MQDHSNALLQTTPKESCPRRPDLRGRWMRQAISSYGSPCSSYGATVSATKVALERRLLTVYSNEPGHDSPQQSPADSPEPMNASNPPLETSSIMATAALPEAPFYQPVSSPHESALPSRYNYVPFRTPRTPQTFPSNFSQFPRSSPQSMSSPK